MGTLRFVTLTGADETTDLQALAALGRQYDYAEWGVLYSPDRAGQGGRYPSLDWLEKFADMAAEEGLNAALHLCGRAVTNLLDGVQVSARDRLSPEVERLLALAAKFGRVQINTHAKRAHLEGYRKLVQELHRTEMRTRVIFQWHESNEPVCYALRGEYGFETLVDSSGGRGLSPTQWPELDAPTWRRVGYAGGLGPDNILEQLRLIDAVQFRTFWVDMESKLRDEEDRFDLGRCERVLSQVCEGYLKPLRRDAMTAWGEGVRQVRTLEGPWLDWWVARSTDRARRLTAPPRDWSKATYLWRQAGEFCTFAPSEQASLATDLLREERIAMMPGDDEEWLSWPVDRPDLKVSHEDSFIIAGLRAIVLKHFGETVPVNAYWEDGLTPSP